MQSKEALKAHAESCLVFVKFLDTAETQELEEYAELMNHFLTHRTSEDWWSFWEAAFEFAVSHHADRSDTIKERKKVAKIAASCAAFGSNEDLEFLADVMTYGGNDEKSIRDKAWDWLHEEREKPKFEIVSRSEPTEPRTEEQPPSESGQPVLVGAPEPA